MKRKLFLFMLAALTATLSAMAEEYIQVSNKKMSFTESWTKSYSYFNDASSGSVSWDAANRKLTLNKFSLWRGGELNFVNIKTCIEVYSTQSVTIEVVGFNKIVNFKGQTLALHGNTTFTGDGTLKLGNNDSKKPGMDLLEENIDITVNGPILKFECSNGGIRGKNNTGTLHLKAGEVQTSSEGKLVTGLANVTFDYGYGVQQPHGAEFSPQQHIMVDPDGNDVKGSAVVLGKIIYLGFRICGVEITENNYDLVNKWDAIKSGSIKVEYKKRSWDEWDEMVESKLILNNVTIHNSTNEPTIKITQRFIADPSPDEFTLELNGKNTFTFEGNSECHAIHYEDHYSNIEGNGSLEVLSDKAGIFLDDSHLYVSSALNVPYIEGDDDSYIEVQGRGSILARGNSKGTVRGVFLKNIAVKSDKNNPCFFSRWLTLYGVYKDKNNLATGEVYLVSEESVEMFGLRVMGEKVHSLNYSNILNHLLESGSISYDPTYRRLYLDNVYIVNNGDIEWYQDDSASLSIILRGDNTMNCNSEIVGNTYIGISKGYGDTGKASLSYIGGWYDKSIKTTDHLSIVDVDINDVKDIEAGTLEVISSKLNVTQELKADNTELRDAFVASTPEAPAYYDSEEQQIVAPKGPVSIVPKSSVTEYPIFFFGEQVTSANASCLMNQYIKTGTLSVQKNSDAYNITMDNLGILYDGTSPMFHFTSTDRVNINIKSWNLFNFTKAGPQAHFISGNSKNINIYGDTNGENILGVLGNTTTNAGAIQVGENSSLKLSNRYVNTGGSFNTVLPRIYGMGSTSTLTIQDPYVTATGNSQGSIANIKCQTGTNAELYSTLSLPLTIGNDGVYLDGKLYTDMVKFVGKGESFIPVTSVRVTPKTLSFTKKGETQKLSASVLPNDATNKEVTWASSDESVVTVDQIGNVKAVGSGTTYVYAYPDGKQDDITESGTVVNRCKVTVDIPQPTSIALDQTDVLIDRESIGGFYLTASLTPSNADTEYTWESSDSTLVTVKNDSGQKALVRRVGDEGQATITVKTANGLSASCNVTVHYPITPLSVEFAQRTYTLTEAGEQLKLEPIVTPDNCEKLSFTWYTSSDAISLSNDGTVTARRNGSAVVECWACYDGQKWAPGEVRINVEIPPTPVIATDLKLKAAHSIFHSLGEAFIITPVFTPENVTNQELAWDTTDASVATVDEDGFVTVVGWGDCYITATTTDGSDIKATYSVTAIDPSTIPDPIYATGIRLDENEVTLMRGEQAYIGVTIEPADYNQSVMIEPMEGDVSIAQVDAQWDWNTNRTCIYIRTEEWSEMSGDLKVRVRPNMVDWDKLNEMGIWMEPADTLTIHVLAPIIFAEASPEDINITYHVTDINDKTCEVYTQPRPGMTMIDPLDSELIPAVSQTATGKLTVPARANGYWVTNVMPCAFNRCSGLTEIDFSEGIETIGDYACYSALYGLERVTLPSTIKELGQYCFSANPSDYATSEDPSGRNYIHEVNIKSFTPPTGQNGSDINWSSAFYNVASDAVLYVPTGALANYNVEPWTQWFSRIEEKQFFEDPDGIASPKSSPEGKDFNWFDLSGRKLGSKPAKPGLYIQNGKKMVIK